MLATSNSQSTMTNYIQIHKTGVDTQAIQRNLNAANEEFRKNETDLQAEFQTLDSLNAVINIEWGDWKHEHAYADYVMRTHGFVKTDEQVTEDDGSDTYSSVHYYKPF